MRNFISINRSGPTAWLGVVRAYIWLFRARRLMKRASGREWLVNERLSAKPVDANVAVRDEDWDVIKQRVAAISRASRYPVSWAYCLQRSLALREWLAKDGIFAEVRYGIRRQDTSFDAHAWVVYKGKIVNDSVRFISTFAPLKSFDDYGSGSRGQIENALVTSKTVGRIENESAGEPV